MEARRRRRKREKAKKNKKNNEIIDKKMCAHTQDHLATSSFKLHHFFFYYLLVINPIPFPSRLVGYISPYPTVVLVVNTHQNEAGMDVKGVSSKWRPVTSCERRSM